MNAPALLLLASTLVLRSGDRIAIDAAPRIENGVMVFRSAGRLYSLPASEIDEEATRAAESKEEKKEEKVRRLRVSEDERRRILAELEKNHDGKPTEIPESLLRPEPPPTRAEVVEQSREEWDWRNRARAFEESVRQAKEELQLVTDEIEDMRNQIRLFITSGFKPYQFTWQTSRLATAEERLPRAELEVRRAERAYDQFRDDARRQGVMPGWLR
jgi:membrane-associated HD superfamily phosphohydrolase